MGEAQRYAGRMGWSVEIMDCRLEVEMGLLGILKADPASWTPEMQQAVSGVEKSSTGGEYALYR